MERQVKVEPHAQDDEHDRTLTFLYKPRYITALFAVLSILIYVALYVTDSDSIRNTKLGLLTCIGLLLLVCLFEFKDGPFIRPHPAFWRIVLGCSVIYQLILTFILFQTKHDVRHLLSYLDPALGVPLPEKSYAEDCSLGFANIWSQMDEFVLAHTLGWFGKALILRDYSLCWIVSILFEIMEYSLQHQLPNFAECWWDHWILDVFLSNWVGLYIGLKTCEYFEMKHYSWMSIIDIHSYRGKLNRGIQQFTPHSWTSFKWQTFKTFKSFCSVLILLFLIIQCELNDFYLKYLLWIPPSHWLNVSRLVLFFFTTLPATRECYKYITDPNCKRLGTHAWLVTINILTELLISIKFAKGEFNQPAPLPVKVFWSLLVILIVTYATWTFGFHSKPRIEKNDLKKVVNHSVNELVNGETETKELVLKDETKKRRSTRIQKI